MRKFLIAAGAVLSILVGIMLDHTALIKSFVWVFVPGDPYGRMGVVMSDPSQINLAWTAIIAEQKKDPNRNTSGFFFPIVYDCSVKTDGSCVEIKYQTAISGSSPPSEFCINKTVPAKPVYINCPQ